ncbi:MAG: Mov34/MPN/PAD-1 family protein, partial [Deltaproteobacteria bacterium]|nr:Mov34/MPN/PAD-1 family protein [Deltaproteobacteria bacterium]
MSRLKIPTNLMEQCYAHGAEKYPDEACGVLSGPEQSDQAEEFHIVDNIINMLHEKDPREFPRTARDGYVLDPARMMKLERELKARGHRVQAIFHSHVDVGAYFSEEDRARATWAGEPLLPGVSYLVCGIRQGRPDGAIIAYFDE